MLFAGRERALWEEEREGKEGRRSRDQGGMRVLLVFSPG